MIVFLFIFILILILLHSWFTFIKDSKKLNVKGPLPLPIVGNGNLFLGDSTQLLQVLGELANKYNDAFRIYILSNRYVCLSHPKYIEPLLSSAELINKGRSYKLVQPWIGDGLVTSSGQKWKKQRKLLTPAFHFNILKSYLPIFVKNVKILRAKLNILANGTPIDIPDILKAYAFDNITETAMGICFNVQTLGVTEYTKAVEELSYVIARRMRNPILANDFLFNLSPHKVRMDKALEVVHRHGRNAIEASRKKIKGTESFLNNNSESGIKHKSFVDLVLLAGQNGDEMNDADIMGEVNTFLFAGHDTVSTASTFALYCISNHKNVQDKIFDEQKTIFGDDMNRDPTYSDLQQMKYLELVIKEALRLFPPGPVIERLITEDTDLAGLYLPKDTLIFINIFQMQRNPKVYEDPLEFRPERFENNEKSPFSWIPFSAGPRNCIGQKFAMLEMKVILSDIVKHFELLPSGRELILIGDLVLKSENGVYINLLPRIVTK